MGARTLAAVVLFGATVGCTRVHAGLANVPAVPGGSPETRVHDVIANGRDGCERWMFPQGGALRGQIPPCGGETTSPPKLAVRVP